MTLRGALANLTRTFAPRARRAYLTEVRAHVEFRRVEGAELDAFTRAVHIETQGLRGLHWVEVNPHTRRVVFAFDRGAYGLPELEAIVALAERRAEIYAGPGTEFGPEHPADGEPVDRLHLEMVADTIAAAVGLALRLSPLPPSALANHALGLVALVRATRLREILVDRLGAERAELALDLLAAAMQTVGQRPGSAFVNALHKCALWREAEALHEVWVRREPELTAERAIHAPDAARPDSRPIPPPRGSVEEYADSAWVLSLAGFGVSFLATRNLQRSVAALFGALPQPARLGKDVFAAELAKSLATRSIVVLDPAVLRRLDRVDCLMLQGDLVSRGRFAVGEIASDGSVAAATAKEKIQALFDPERPVDCRAREGWTLGPLPLLRPEPPPLLTLRSVALARSGALTLGLVRDAELVAIVEMRVIPQTGAEELIAAARHAGIHVVLGSADEGGIQGLDPDDVLPAGMSMEEGVRRLQREGRTVAVVGTAAQSTALARSDCGIGLVRAGEPPPWGAALICRSELSDVRFIVRACVAAREVAKQSVNIALGSATLGALVAAGGATPVSTSRVLAVVNTASLVSMANGLRASIELERQAPSRPRDRTPWHALDAEGVLRRLGTSEKGLLRNEVARRAPPQRRERPALVDLGEAITDELFNPLAPLLAAGAGLSAVVGSMTDAGMVGTVVVLNALVGGVQRFFTERAIRDLSRSSRRRAVARRAGIRQEVDADELVQGDVVELYAGDVVPADCRIIDAASLEVDASSLTGESLPVPKVAAPSFQSALADRSSMLFEGTAIASGRAVAVVVAAGEETEARRAAVASPRARGPSGVDERLRSLVNLTGPVALASGAGLVGFGLLRGQKLADLVGSGVSLAVASVPEGLPLLATAAELASAKRLARRGVLVRNPNAIEVLGRVEVLCVDKTGTVTEGRIELASVSDGSIEESVSRLSDARLAALAIGLRATAVRRPDEGPVDPTDAALVRVAARIGLVPQMGSPGWRRDQELTFEAGRGYHTTVARVDAGRLVSVKGAPETVLRQCATWRRAGKTFPLDAVARGQLHVLAGLLAHRGLRIIAVAERLVESETEAILLDRLDRLEFRGFLTFSDPVRPTAAAALMRLAQAGVCTVMATGDHPSTAKAIATELGLLPGDVLTGSELARMNDEELDARIEAVRVFARVAPAQKVRVVRAYQRRGRVVAMAGDGANDAPAIRLADVGIAIGERSTAAARGAADVVVTDERVETLVDAIVEGRALWASVRDAVSILVGGNLGEIGFALAGGLIDGRSPLNPRQLLLVNLLTDVAPAVAVALRPASESSLAALAQEGPDTSLGRLLDRDIATRAIVTSAGAGAAWLLSRLTSGEERARTVGLVALVGTQLGQTISSGGVSGPVLTTSLASAAVLGAIVQTPGLSRLFGCRPLGPLGWATAIAASAAATGAAAALPEAIDALRERLGVDAWLELARGAVESALAEPSSGHVAVLGHGTVRTATGSGSPGSLR
ncbi:MAG: cation-translocating P-type ATPase [Polyangiaceae bacterium]|nr:cation-translocating P-type ATPase [Polyangiaceae bacterium]